MPTATPMPTTTTDRGAEIAPDPIHPALAPYVATLPPDAELDRHAAALTAAWSTLSVERERGADLRRRRAALTAALGTETGDARTALLGDLVILDADAATVPASLGEASRRYALARLGWFSRVLALAEAEARGLVAATDAPITALGRARHAADVAEGYFGAAPAPAKVPALRAAAAEMATDLAPALERYRRATEATEVVRSMVSSAYGDVSHFNRGDFGSSTWETVATRAGEAAADRARRETAA